MDKIEELKVKIRKKLDKKREEKLPEPHPFLYKKERLKQKLIRDVIIKPNHEIVLSSGRTTNIYVDCTSILYSAEGQHLIGYIIYQLIKDQNIQAIGGPAMGADPIALATTFMSNYTKNQINAFSVRIKAKTYGMGKKFYGEVNKGDNVILIDDVLTTGNSLRDTILICEKRGLIIKRIIVLVDRQEGGKEALENLGYNVQSVFTIRQLIS